MGSTIVLLMGLSSLALRVSEFEEDLFSGLLGVEDSGVPGIETTLRAKGLDTLGTCFEELQGEERRDGKLTRFTAAEDAGLGGVAEGGFGEAK